ncbi:MAG: hypothetical protein WCL29_05235, partial [Pseudomonadota bacterium]
MNLLRNICLLTKSICVVINGISTAATPDFLGAGEIVNRSDLTYSALNSAQSSLVDFRAYAFPANAANSDQTFRGTLTLIGTNSSGSITEIGTTMSAAYKDPGHLPEFSYQFIQAGSHIFPVKRGLISTSHPDWYY